MPGTNLRLGLSGFGEGIAQGIRFGTESKERVLWHREGLRREAKEREYDEKRQLRNIGYQTLISESVKDKRDKLDQVIKLRDDWDNIGYDSEKYLDIRNKFSAIIEGIRSGDIFDDVDRVPETGLPENFLSERSKILIEEDVEKKRRWEWENRDKTKKKEEKIPRMYVFENPETGTYEFGEGKTLRTLVKDINALDTFGVASKAQKEKRIHIMNAFMDDPMTPEEAEFEASNRNLKMIPSKLDIYRKASEKEFGKDLSRTLADRLGLANRLGEVTKDKKPETPTFEDILSQVNKETQRNYSDLDEDEKNWVKEGVKSGDDITALIADILEIKEGK